MFFMKFGSIVTLGASPELLVHTNPQGEVYLEALACGLPVVASKADASREVVRDGELGIVVDPKNPAEIRAGILTALKEPKGILPAGLCDYSYENFRNRVRVIVDELRARAARVAVRANGSTRLPEETSTH